VTHLTPDQLGDVDEVAGNDHLRTCERCRARWQEQRDVRDLLRTLPDPGAMPPDVAAGLADALRGLTPEDVTRGADAPPSRSGGDTLDDAEPAGRTIVPLRPAARRDQLGRRARPWLAAAAAVVVLGGGGAALVSHPWSSTGDTNAATSSAGGSQPTPEGASRDASSAAARVLSTGTDYQRAQLPTQVRRDLLGRAAPTGQVSTPPSAPGVFDDSAATGDTRLATPQGLASCLSALGVDAGQVSTVDLATFEGRPAALVVVHAASGAYDVWVVGRGCREGDDQTRYFVRLP
jgi:hypothetical protein